ncbi:hypothetical protein [Shewanella decolorationis]|uniref:Uncharacterized protein n=1 Tax=Shewanella decolorationis S12 TaxID=1353536 RepID=A0ABP2Z086_9GAMM|nr:hypothetical protein [Shewanella decolorationis]ESE40049.1 hypothetical protein SHD_3178 [Shewanella decolorationis S12]GLR34169.1 hypothetical protein GCM10007922_37280 [Shewanella decolorationis]
MGIKLPPDQLALYKRIDEILYHDWDPIGVSGLGGPADEYYGYLPQVFKRALYADDPQEIAEYLTWVTVERMGVSPAKEHDLKIASQILASKRELIHGK